MTERTWEHDAPSLAITVRWGDTPLHAAHLDPPRSFFLGGAGADVVLPESAVGPGRTPLLLAERGALYLVLLPSMDPDGAITTPDRGARTVGELARAGMAEASPDVPGAFLVKLVAGMTAALTIGDFAITIALETKAARAVAGHWHVGRRMVPFQIGSAALHLALMGAAAFLAGPLAVDSDEPSAEQIYYLQQVFQAIAEKEDAEQQRLEDRYGTRARGEEGSLGQRFGVMGPRDGDPRVARASALRDAAEFGVIGLLGSGSGGNPGSARPAPRTPDRAPRSDGAAADKADDGADRGVNPLVDPRLDRVSTFAVDVDTGAYAMARRSLQRGELPAPASVRPEEFLNSFDYRYAGPDRGAVTPFAVHLAAAPSPFAAGHHLLRVGVQGRRIAAKDRAPAHLVYLVDTSGSMRSADRIGLAKASLALLTESLKPGDTVALCTYAGSVREVLPPTGIDQRARILAAIQELDAAGATAMESGIDLAYRLAERTLVRGEVNRVIVLSDGDANVGATSHEAILAKIRRYKDLGITLSTVGFGQGNYQDAMMEQLADQGDGNYTYIDGEREARRAFKEQVGGLLEVIARDVKIQVDFNPDVVRRYRLIGYENRDVRDEQFRDDQVDGGEIGAGHSVTAVYDVILATTSSSPVTVRLRHKTPFGREAARESAFAMSPRAIAPSFDEAPASLRFAAAVAGFAEILRRSPHAEGWRLADVEQIARASAGDDDQAQQLVTLVHTGRSLDDARLAGGWGARVADASLLGY